MTRALIGLFGALLLLGVTGCSDSTASKDSFVNGQEITKPTISGDKAMKDRGMTDEEIAKAKAAENSYGGGPMSGK